MMLKNKSKDKRKLLRVGPKAPFSFVEAYKTLRTNLEFISASNNNKCQVILVTSSVPMEGKSNVAINLAITLAAGNKKVLMVDCDLRKGALTRYMGLNQTKKGLTNYFTGQCTMKEALYIDKTSNCVIMPSGPLSPAPAELLMGEKTRLAFDEMREEFDYIIVDAPPSVVVTDAAVISRLSDGVVIVVCPGLTTIQQAQQTKKNLEAVNAHVIGVIMNGCSAKEDRYYYSYNYDSND